MTTSLFAAGILIRAFQFRQLCRPAFVGGFPPDMLAAGEPDEMEGEFDRLGVDGEL
ncbi:hypothetical protein [Aquisphaera insulae]|uniref:hypothetical protein n=1 Tax=Aquisphaera insulae TaxID=2712864 RepID=UPI0013ECD273|nr:hypothetical protein [Aquisphaera insulae]